MAVKIVTLRNQKVIAKKFIKALKKMISIKPDIRIGLIWDDSLANIYEYVIKSKKLKWENVKIFSLVEYKDAQSITFENTLYTEFINKLNNVTRQNYESIKERIDELRKEDNINDLYKFDGLIDLMVFPIDKRGNFLFNDFESKINYINYGNNGNDIICPGIKSIMLAKQVICFVLEEDSQKVVNTLNTKTLSSNEFLSLLNVHDNITLYTLYNIIRKKEINKNNYVHDPEGLADKVLSTSFEGSLSTIVDEPVTERISDITKEVFGDNNLSLDDETEDDDFEDEEIDDLELSEKEVEVEDEPIVDSDVDDGLPIDEPLNVDKNNLNDAIKEVLGGQEDDIEPTDEELRQIELEEEELFESIKDDYESSINEEDSLLDSVTESKFDLDSSEVEDKYFAEEVNATTIGHKEIPSALFKSNDLDESIIKQLQEMEKLKDDEVYLKQYQAEIDDEINELQKIQQELENELASMENNKEANPSFEKSTQLNDIYENDPVSSTADQYTKKHDTVVLFDDQQEKIQVVGDNEDSIDSQLIADLNDTGIDLKDLNQDQLDDNKLMARQVSFENPDFESYGSTKEEIQKIIDIKIDALKAIELMLKNNKLGIHQLKTDGKSSLDSNGDDYKYVKLTYLPSEKPVPLLMVNTEANEKIYESTILDMIDVFKSNMNARLFSKKNNHFWNMGAYVSVNKKTNELELCAFSDISNLIFLLRYINKETHLWLSKTNYLIIQNELDKFYGEFKIEHINLSN